MAGCLVSGIRGPGLVGLAASRRRDVVMRPLATYLSFSRFSHSVFALPFALTGALLAAREQPMTGRRWPGSSPRMVTARSAAMGFNRLVDARFDAKNPRTSMREIPRGRDERHCRRWRSSAMSSAAFVFSPG